MKFGVLGSGSAGNSVLVESGETRVLIDAGFSARELVRRLESVGRSPEEITAIVITHDHGDHTRGMGVFARKYGTPLCLTQGTRIACDRLLTGKETVRYYRPGYPLEVDSLRIDPFITVHDAADPVAVAVVEVKTDLRLGVATDLGRPTAQVRHALAESDFLILEANHDEELLHTSAYPFSVRRRIASSHGHLSNHAAAQFAEELLHPRLTGVLLAHLSRECNTPQLALDVVGTRLRDAGFKGYLEVAAQDQPTAILDVEELRGRIGPAQLNFL